MEIRTSKGDEMTQTQRAGLVVFIFGLFMVLCGILVSWFTQLPEVDTTIALLFTFVFGTVFTIVGGGLFIFDPEGSR
jgi:hypothetical protein